MADDSGMNGMQSAGLALANFADAMAQMSGRQPGYAANQLKGIQALQQQLLMTQQLHDQNAKRAGLADFTGATAPQTINVPPPQAGLATAPPDEGSGAPPDGSAPGPALNPGITQATQVTIPGTVGSQIAGTPQEFSQDKMDALKRAFPDQVAQATLAQAMAGPKFEALGKGGGVMLDAQGNVVKKIDGAPDTKGDTDFVNLVRTDDPNAKPQAFSKNSAAALLSTGKYAVAGDMSMAPRESYRPMTAAELQQWGLAPGTVASMGSNGKPQVINKATPGSFLADQGIVPDSTPDDVRAKLMTNDQGANLVRQADAILQGKDELAKMASRSGQTQGNQLREVVYALDPTYNPLVGKQRVQINAELNNLGDKAMGGKLASADKIINHASDLLDSAIDLKNNSMFGNVGNQVENAAVGVGTGSAMKTNLRDFSDIRTKLGAESAKFMGGGAASDSARDEVNQSYNPNDDITGTIGAVAGTLKTMVGQIQPLVDRYNQAYGTNLPITDPKFMSPETAQKLTLLQGIVDTAKSGAALNPTSLKTSLAKLGVGKIAPGSAAAPATAALAPGTVLPALPPGAKMLPDGRAQLPDGTILRRQ